MAQPGHGMNFQQAQDFQNSRRGRKLGRTYVRYMNNAASYLSKKSPYGTFDPNEVVPRSVYMGNSKG